MSEKKSLYEELDRMIKVMEMQRDAIKEIYSSFDHNLRDATVHSYSAMISIFKYLASERVKKRISDKTT